MAIVPRTRFLRERRRHGLVYGLFVGGLLAAGSGHAVEAPKTPNAADVLGTLHESDQKEIQAGEIAQKNGKSKAVRDYGKMLVRDHTSADEKVTALAHKENVDLLAATPAPGPNEMGTMATGPDFDKKFAQEMLDDHRKAIAALTAARDQTTDPQLRKLLTDLLPTLEKHADAAQKIVDAQLGK
jgi:putative membrane protein